MSIFPFLQPQIFAAASNTALPPYCDVKWDYVRDVPVFSGGEPVLVTGIEAVMGWAWRALHTERYQHPVYSWDYGCEISDLIGQNWTRGAKEAEAARYIRECLTANPYITGVDDIRAQFADGVLTLSCTVRIIYGDERLEALI